MGAHKILNETLLRLTKALEGGASDLNCLRSWSAFIRVRDGNRCLACSSTHSRAAHHIVRKSFLPESRFETGNGITLCSKCHRSAHAGFNGKADLAQPIDAQGVERIAAETGPKLVSSARTSRRVMQSGRLRQTTDAANVETRHWDRHSRGSR